MANLYFRDPLITVINQRETKVNITDRVQAVEIISKLTMAWNRQWKCRENDEFDRYLRDNFGDHSYGYPVRS